MITKKQYNLNDRVWIHGVKLNNGLTEGKVVKSFTIDGYVDQTFYVIEVSNHIEPLLEIRTWETISQDDQGPVGSFRDIDNLPVIHKLASHVGYRYNSETTDPEDPSADVIHAALEKSIDSSIHKPLILKDNKHRPRRKFNRRKPRE